MIRMISMLLLAVAGLTGLGAQPEVQRITVSGYRLWEKGVLGKVQDISGLKGLSVSPASGQVWSNALDVAANANVFEVTVPFGYRLGWWMESADDDFSRTDGERIAGSEGVTRLEVDFRPDGRTLTFIAPVLLIDDNRTFELRKSRFGSGTVGTNYATYACQKGDVFHLFAVPTRDSETALDLSSFRRWSDGSAEPRRDVLIDTNAALTAEFVPASWKVSFDPTGGSVFPKAKTVTCEAAYGWMPDPVRSGHDFTGWFNQPLNGNRVAFETKVGAVGDHTLFAHWQALLYAVSATYGGAGNGKVEGVGDYPFGAEVLLKAEPFEGYRFAGWADGETRNPRRIRVTGDVAYEALFEVATYEVSFSYRDEKGALVTTSPQTVSHGEGATPPGEELYDRWPEHAFVNWSTEEYKCVTRDLAGRQAVSAIYDDVTYAVRFAYRDRDGNAVTTMPQHVVSGAAAVPPGADTADIWKGHALLGWNPDYHSVGSDLLIEGQYEKKTYSVTFVYRDAEGKEAKEIKTYSYLDAVAFEEVDLLKDLWPRHTFKYWSLNGRPVEGEVKVEQDLQISAVYEGYATIRYLANGGEGEMPTQVYTNDFGEVFLASNAFTKTGYAFQYWTMGDEKFSDGQSVRIQDGTALVLTAQWAPIEYTYSFDANDGEIPEYISGVQNWYYEKNHDARYGEEYSIQEHLNNNTASIIAPDGKKFSFWSLNKDEAAPADGSVPPGCYKEAISNLTTVAGSNVTLYAIWKGNPQTVVINGQTNELAYGSQLQKPDDPAPKLGYTFSGEWTTNDEDAVGFPIVVTHGFELKPLRVPNPYRIVFNGTDGTYETSGTTEPQDFTYDVAQPLTSNGFARTGHTFANWTNEANRAFADGEVVSNLTAEANGEVTLAAAWTANGYTVEFRSGEGTGEMQPQDFTYDVAQPLTSNGFMRTGHTFANWTNEANRAFADGEVVSNLTAEADATNTLFAVWTVNRYEIRYDSAGGSAVSVQTNEYGATTAEPQPPTKTGYAFAGWYADGDRFEFGGPMPAENLVLTAHWTANDYTVKFLPGEGGSGTMEDQAFTYDVPQALLKNQFTNLQWKVFGCWTNANGDAFEDGAEVTNLTSEANGVVKLTACWADVPSYTVAFDGNGATGGEMSELRVACGAGGTLTSNRFERIGYAFANWTNETGDVFNDGAKFTKDLAPTNGTATLYAAWTQNSYRVVFNGTDGTYETSGTTAPQDFTYDVAQPLTSNGFMRTGHTFANWTNEANRAFADGEVVSNLTAEADATNALFAVWTVNRYEIRYDSAGGSAVSVQTNEYGATTAEPQPPTKTGYAFAGWYAGDELFAFGGPMPAENLVLTAHWTANGYKVKFLPGEGGGGTMPDQTFVYDTPQALSENRFTNLQWMVFANWTNANGDFFANGAEVTNLTSEANGVVKLTACWADVPSYTVAFDGNGATDGAMPELRVACGAGGTLTSNRFERTGYAFANWTNETGNVLNDGAKFTEDLAPTNETATLYAAWTPNSYTVKFDGNGADGGKTMEAQKFTYDVAEALTSNAFTKTGHTFSCWTNEAATGMSPPRLTDGEVVSNLTAQANGEVTLRAVWSVKSYNLSFDGENSVSRTYGQPITLIDPKEKPGYVFSGWYDGEIKYEDGMPMPAYDLNLVSKYEPIAYTIAFDSNGGSGLAMPDIAATYGQTYRLPECSYQRDDGYDFVRWTNATVTAEMNATAGASVSNLTTRAGDEVKLFAQWSKATNPLSVALGIEDLKVTVDSEGAWKVKGNPTDKAGVVRTSSDPDGTLCVEIPGPGTLDFDFTNDLEILSALKYSFGENDVLTKNQGTVTYTCDGEGTLIFSGKPSSGKTWTLSNFVWTPKSE